MKKLILSVAMAFVTAFCALAADMTTVWEQLTPKKTFIVADFDAEKAAQNGFETLSVALNSAPTTQDINEVKRLADTIDASQKVTSISQDGINVAIYAAPASTDLKFFKVMLIIDKNGEGDKSLMIFYGTCDSDNMLNAVQSLQLDDLIG